MTALAQASQPSPLSVFRNRSFSLLWTGQLVSTIGSALTSLAAGILVYRITGSALSVGLMLMATAVPSIFVGLVAGVFVDRMDRKRILVIADVVRAVLVFLIPFLIPHNIVWLYVIVLLTSAVGQFYDPAHESILPEVATDEELAAANSLMAISSFGSTAVGFAAAGLIASAANINWAFYIDSATFIFSAVCVLLIRIKPYGAMEEKTSVAAVVSNMKSGLKFLFDSQIMRSLFFVSVPVFLSFGLWNALLLPFAKRALNATEFEYGLQEGLTSVGFVIGSLLMARLADRLRAGQWIVISFVGMGIAGVLYAFSRSIPIAIFYVMLSGLLNSPSAIARRLVVQRNTTREMRGRVFSAFFVSRDVVLLLGMAAGGLADIFNVRYLIFIGSLLLVVAGGLALAMPGLGQPAAEWRRTITLLRGAKVAPRLGIGRGATLVDMDLLVSHMPALARMTLREKEDLAAHTLVAEAATGTPILQLGEVSDSAYFILNGQAVAGRPDGDSYRTLETLNAGDFFGEIAALTGVPRTADVIASEPTTLLQVPSATLRHMMSDPLINHIFLTKMTERMVRMDMVDLPRFVGLDQTTLRQLRTVESEPAT